MCHNIDLKFILLLKLILHLFNIFIEEVFTELYELFFKMFDIILCTSQLFLLVNYFSFFIINFLYCYFIPQ